MTTLAQTVAPVNTPAVFLLGFDARIELADRIARRRLDEAEQAAWAAYEPTPAEEAERLALSDEQEARDEVLAELDRMAEEACWQWDYEREQELRADELMAREAGGWDRIIGRRLAS